MSEELPAVIQNTQKILGKYLKKPPLTEKLLTKPPFRFLHDVIIAVIREHGFLKGLYSEKDLMSENVKDKDAKIAFLNKLVDAVKTITEIELTVRPSKVIAGLEPVETNFLLQAIGIALDKKLSSTNYISQFKTSKQSKKQVPTKNEEKKVKQENKIKEKISLKGSTSKESNDKVSVTPRVKKKESSRTAIAEKTERNTKKVVTPRNLQEKQTPKTDAAPKSKNKKITVQENSPKEIELNSNTSFQTKISPRDNKNDTKSSIIETNQEANVEEKHLRIEIKSQPSNNILHIAEKIIKANDETDNAKIDRDVQDSTVANTGPARIVALETPIERPKSARPKSGKEKYLQAKMQEQRDRLEKPSESIMQPRSSLRPPSVRPSSARPGAPRLRSETSLPLDEVIPLGKVNIIVENYANKDDDEETVVIQAASEPEYQTKTLELPADKGHLVEQILEQIHEDDNVEQVKPRIDIEWEHEGLRSRDAASKEIEQLRTGIQTLTRTANPLGKLINYLHEDVEAMHSELDMWNNIKRQITIEIEAQKRINEDSNKPLQAQLEDLQENIKKYQQQILLVQANILRNDARIQDLTIK